MTHRLILEALPRLPFSRAALPGLLVLALALGTGCTTVQPVEKPTEAALAPAATGFWNTLEGSFPGDRFQLLDTGDQALEWRLRAIASATTSIDLQTFLWLGDGTGMTVLGAMLDAADRGVKLRILLDDSFTVGEGQAIAAFAAHPNVEFRIYNPFGERPDSLVLRQVENFGDFSRVDHRMHNKSMVVDGHATIVGGRNIADEYFGRHSQSNFRDLEVVGFGPVAQRIAATFDQFWNSPWAIPAEDLLGPAPAGEQLDALAATIRQAAIHSVPETESQRLDAWNAMLQQAIPARAEILTDRPAESDPATELPNQLSAQLMGHMDEADTELVLISAYLVPTDDLADAIRRAEERGVSVRILTNSLRSNNHTAAHSAYRRYVHRLVSSGADLHEVRALAKDRSKYMLSPVDQKELGLHAKAILIDDDKSFVGSANLDPRSLELNTEMGLLIHSEAFNRSLRAALDIDFHPRNAWHLQETDAGKLRWIADDQTLDTQPAESRTQRLEDWFLSKLPIGKEM